MRRASSVVGMLLAGLFLLATPASPAADLFVDVTSGSDANDGLSWPTARMTVTSALATAAGTPEPDTVSVAAGRYPERITVTANVILLGGFPPGGGARDPARFETTLDAERRGQVVYFPPGSDGTVLDGFVITGGSANSPRLSGGGILVEDSAPLIRGNMIKSNRAFEYGGGVYAFYTSARAPLRIAENVFQDNVALSLGAQAAALAVWGPLDMDLGPVLTGNTIAGNSSTKFAAVVSMVGRSGTIRDNILDDNIGGLALAGSWTVTNVLVVRNRTINREEGIDIYGPGTTRLENVTVAGNPQGVVVDRSSCSALNLVISDSILWGNGGANLSWDATCPTPIVISSIVGGGHPGGTNVIDADPNFVSGPLGDHYLSQILAGQAMTSPGVDAGDQDAVTSGLDTRTTASSSVADAGVLDLGYHYAPAPLTILRGTQATSLAEHARVAGLPFRDSPGTLSDPALPLLFYQVPETDNDIAVDKDMPSDRVRLSFRVGP